MAKDQEKFRQAKAHVISVLAEFAKTCQSKQVTKFLVSADLVNLHVTYLKNNICSGKLGGKSRI